jgi:hypothetical protein
MILLSLKADLFAAVVVTMSNRCFGKFGPAVAMGVGQDGAFADTRAFGQFAIGSAGSAGDLDLIPGGFGNCPRHGVICSRG